VIDIVKVQHVTAEHFVWDRLAAPFVVLAHLVVFLLLLRKKLLLRMIVPDDVPNYRIPLPLRLVSSLPGSL
jgi:hypothetical protein